MISFENQPRSKAADKTYPEPAERECPLHISKGVVGILRLRLVLRLGARPILAQDDK